MGNKNAKNRDIISILHKNGYEFKRHKGSHAMYYKGTTRIIVPISTHQNPYLLGKLIKQYNLVV